jgi:POT family proton-dependent oligopeptide transporter
MQNNTDQFFESKVLGHPSGLFVLFFTEMWERFSYYGMRALLVMFLTASILDDGWGWPSEWAYALFGSYTALVYLSTMLGGYFADKIIGYRKAVLWGALLMTLGHAAMALETQASIYLGLTFLVFGSGFFKPNMTSIISEVYQKHPEKKDGAYTIFYMGVNAGAFLGILLCGYLGETVGWSIGFGLAGVFMLFGLLQFWFSQNIFAHIGLKPNKNEVVVTDSEDDKKVPFTTWQYVVIAVSTIIGLIWIINDPASKISGGDFNMLDFTLFGVDGTHISILFAILLFFVLLVYRINQYSPITKDKMIAITFFAVMTTVFWAIFEQAPTSLTVFARDYTDRILDGSSAMTFKIFNSLMTIIPLGIITWVLFKFFGQTFKKYPLGNVFLGASFVIIWTIAIFMLYSQFQDSKAEIPASWFGVLNSLFIIALAPLFSKWWESKYNPSANMKYGIGMILLGAGMACVAIGASGIAPGAVSASESIIWLILVYFFHTLGELCISPVGLSYVSKLAPAKMIAFMFGIWYLAVAIGMKSAGKFSEVGVEIANEHGLSYFFWILTAIPVVFGLISIVFQPIITKLMHGVK